MRKTSIAASLALLTVLSVSVSSCMSNRKKGMMKPPFGSPKDVAQANDLWSRISGYRTWQSPAGMSGFQKGRSPHGKYLKYYLNSIAARDPLAPGAIVVKENYMGKSDSMLGPVTAMEKIPGYDPADGDWFWVKFNPRGEVMKNPMGMSLAGKVAKGMKKGCIACHANAGGGDFLFVNDE